MKTFEVYPQIKAKFLSPSSKDTAVTNEIEKVVWIICGNDTGKHNIMIKNRRWQKVNDHPFLEKIFPGIRIYKWTDHRHSIDLLINLNGKAYSLSQFNELLRDNKIAVTAKNIIRLAKAFVVLSTGEEYGRNLLGEMLGIPTQTSTGERADEVYGFPPIAFLEEKKIREERMIGKKKNVTYTAIFKVKVGEEISNWYLPQDIYEKGQFGGATLNDKDNNVVKIIQLPIIEIGK